MQSKLSLVAIATLLVSLPGSAHHSHGNYADTFADIKALFR